jgi:hypothetical protein
MCQDAAQVLKDAQNAGKVWSNFEELKVDVAKMNEIIGCNTFYVQPHKEKIKYQKILCLVKGCTY